MPQKTPDSLKTPQKGDARRDPGVTPSRLAPSFLCLSD